MHGPPTPMVGWANLLRFTPYVQVADTQRDAWGTPMILQQGIAYPHSSPVQSVLVREL
jgi:hypothetical protein